MQDQEVIIIVNINLGPLVGSAAAVFNIQGVKLEIIFQKLQIRIGGVYDLMPLKISQLVGFNHAPSRFKKII
jgi:hypothetical protein